MRSRSAEVYAASPWAIMTRFATAAASCSRMPRPMPLVEPVITAARPASGLPRPAASGVDFEESGMLDHPGAFVDLMDEDATQGIDLAVPGFLFDGAADIVVTCLPAPADPF